MSRIFRQSVSCGAGRAVSLWLCLSCLMTSSGSEPIVHSSRLPAVPASQIKRPQSRADIQPAPGIVILSSSLPLPGIGPIAAASGQEMPVARSQFGAVGATALETSDVSRVQSSPAASCMVLDGRDIACRVSVNWLPADVLRQRARSLVSLFEDAKPEQRQAAASLARFLCLQADHQQDIGASSGLRTYYSRIALDEQLCSPTKRSS